MEPWIVREAELLGLASEQAGNEVELIRMIQLKEGHPPCFDTKCYHPDLHNHCGWKELCQAGLFSFWRFTSAQLHNRSLRFIYNIN